MNAHTPLLLRPARSFHMSPAAMPVLRAVLWSVLPLLVLPCGPDCCSVHESSGSSPNESPLLASLHCHNNYESYVHCRWTTHGDVSPQLWFQTENSRTPCVPYRPPGHDEDRTDQCRYETQIFSIGVKHTVFFLENQTQSVCSSVPHEPLDLSQLLRARSPADLSAHDAGDGGRWLSWTSPYSSSSSWSRDLSYQLSYRPDLHDHWTTENVMNTRVKLERQLLFPGHRYEARVRARASVGQWSAWSPVVAWKTEEDKGQVPHLQCVLHGEREVLCSWEVSRERAAFISYRLACRRHRTAPSESCCTHPVRAESSGSTALRYSCTLSVTDPAQLLELTPTHRARTFKAYQHIRPRPPQNLTVREKDKNWILEWTEPSLASKLKLFYQVCYGRTQDPNTAECPTLLNISEGVTSLTIQGASLASSQPHQVKVRSLVAPGHGSTYKGIPSKWTDPVNWTSHAAIWSLTTLMYVLISVFVAMVFFTLYCTIPACRRRAVLWVESVPSPHKSNILCEIKCVTSWPLQTEDTSFSKVLLDTSIASECSSHVSLVPISSLEENQLEPDEGFWNSDDLSIHPEKISFSGPYIFCQASDSGFSTCRKTEEEIQRSEPEVEEHSEEEDKTSSDDSSPPVSFNLNGDGYVSLPNGSVSRSTQDLVGPST